jgi:hypothetical protein
MRATSSASWPCTTGGGRDAGLLVRAKEQCGFPVQRAAVSDCDLSVFALGFVAPGVPAGGLAFGASHPVSLGIVQGAVEHSELRCGREIHGDHDRRMAGVAAAG